MSEFEKCKNNIFIRQENHSNDSQSHRNWCKTDEIFFINEDIKEHREIIVNEIKEIEYSNENEIHCK